MNTRYTSHRDPKTGEVLYSNDDPGYWKGNIFVPTGPSRSSRGGVGAQARSDDPQLSDDPEKFPAGGVQTFAKGGAVDIKPQNTRRSYAKGGPVKRLSQITGIGSLTRGAK